MKQTGRYGFLFLISTVILFLLMMNINNISFGSSRTETIKKNIEYFQTNGSLGSNDLSPTNKQISQMQTEQSSHSENNPDGSSKPDIPIQSRESNQNVIHVPLEQQTISYRMETTIEEKLKQINSLIYEFNKLYQENNNLEIIEKELIQEKIVKLESKKEKIEKEKIEKEKIEENLSAQIPKSSTEKMNLSDNKNKFPSDECNQKIKRIQEDQIYKMKLKKDKIQRAQIAFTENINNPRKKEELNKLTLEEFEINQEIIHEENKIRGIESKKNKNISERSQISTGINHVIKDIKTKLLLCLEKYKFFIYLDKFINFELLKQIIDITDKQLQTLQMIESDVVKQKELFSSILSESENKLKDYTLLDINKNPNNLNYNILMNIERIKRQTTDFSNELKTVEKLIIIHLPWTQEMNQKIEKLNISITKKEEKLTTHKQKKDELEPKLKNIQDQIKEKNEEEENFIQEEIKKLQLRKTKLKLKRIVQKAQLQQLEKEKNQKINEERVKEEREFKEKINQ